MLFDTATSIPAQVAGNLVVVIFLEPLVVTLDLITVVDFKEWISITSMGHSKNYKPGAM